MKKILEYLTNSCYNGIVKNRRRDVKMDKKGKFKAIDIAIWFVWKNKIEKQNNETEYDDKYEVYEGLSHLKLQKLLYYAQGLGLAINGSPIFSDKIVAWEHGPVVKDVYKYFKSWGREDINITIDETIIDSIKKIEENESVANILNITYENFGIYTAWQLREMSHVARGPWETTVRKKKMGAVIDKELIKNYFLENFVENEA